MTTLVDELTHRLQIGVSGTLWNPLRDWPSKLTTLTVNFENPQEPAIKIKLTKFIRNSHETRQALVSTDLRCVFFLHFKLFYLEMQYTKTWHCFCSLLLGLVDDGNDLKVSTEVLIVRKTLHTTVRMWFQIKLAKVRLHSPWSIRWGKKLSIINHIPDRYQIHVKSLYIFDICSEIFKIFKTLNKTRQQSYPQAM